MKRESGIESQRSSTISVGIIKRQIRDDKLRKCRSANNDHKWRWRRHSCYPINKINSIDTSRQPRKTGGSLITPYLTTKALDNMGINIKSTLPTFTMYSSNCCNNRFLSILSLNTFPIQLKFIFIKYLNKLLQFTSISRVILSDPYHLMHILSAILGVPPRLI